MECYNGVSYLDNQIHHKIWFQYESDNSFSDDDPDSCSKLQKVDKGDALAIRSGKCDVTISVFIAQINGFHIIPSF